MRSLNYIGAVSIEPFLNVESATGNCPTFQEVGVMNLVMAMITFGTVLHASAAVAGSMRVCTAQREMIQAIVDARDKGIDKNILIGAAGPTLSEPDKREAVIRAVQFVYSVDRTKLPQAAQMVFKICLALSAEGDK